MPVEIDVNYPDVETIARQLWEISETAFNEHVGAVIKSEWPGTSMEVAQFMAMATNVREWLVTTMNVGVQAGHSAAQVTAMNPSQN